MKLFLKKTTEIVNAVNEIIEIMEKTDITQLSEKFREITLNNLKEQIDTLENSEEKILAEKMISMHDSIQETLLYASNPLLTQIFLNKYFFQSLILHMEINKTILGLNEFLFGNMPDLLIIQNQIVNQIWKILFNFMAFHTENEARIPLYMEVTPFFIIFIMTIAREVNNSDHILEAY